ncbi:hypothetical protein PoB_001547200 [Plakobranchus ocellatus]|uniref:Uncharacterized protein n=1 Tax=Plakobranchus ocellatus TaxID=259542 RepID=A0AAV3Z196_9GAST|nr:hypothetical protein PoB_001547200 [Plakobranchus ocellatus]
MALSSLVLSVFYTRKLRCKRSLIVGDGGAVDSRVAPQSAGSTPVPTLSPMSAKGGKERSSEICQSLYVIGLNPPPLPGLTEAIRPEIT